MNTLNETQINNEQRLSSVEQETSDLQSTVQGLQERTGWLVGNFSDYASQIAAFSDSMNLVNSTIQGAESLLSEVRPPLLVVPLLPTSHGNSAVPAPSQHTLFFQQQGLFNEEARVNITALQAVMVALEANLTAFEGASLFQLVLNITDLTTRIAAQQLLWANLDNQASAAQTVYLSQQGGSA